MAKAFRTGLQRDSRYLAEGEYLTLLNGLFDSVDEGKFSLTNEMSNILSSKFKEGFKVIHATNDILTNTTYFFLVNPETGVGEFGQIRNIQQYQNIDDTLNACDECENKYDLAEPLESQEQTELNTYETLLTDACHIENEEPEKGFMFSVDFPIKKSVIKNEKCGKTIYFTDNRTFPKYIILDKLAQYQTTGSIVCGDDQTESTCIDIEKTRLFRKYNRPFLTPTSIELGGRLKEGVYEFLLAYCDSEGNELSEYTFITNPVNVFDKNNINKTEQEISERTNFSIRLEAKNLDPNFNFYKVAVIQTTTDSINTASVFIEGIHPINDTSIIYSTEQDKRPSTISDLLRENLFIDLVEFVSEANNSLILGGISQKKEINLQPVVNLLSGAFKWQTHIAPEDLYEDGVASSIYLGYNRDEVVPFAFRFLLDDGFKTSAFPIVGRPSTDTDEELVEDNKDINSILANVAQCNTENRNKRWQVYNTATEEGDCFLSEDIETQQVTETITKICFVEDIAVSENQELEIQTSSFTNITDYINENKNSCADNPEVFGDTDLCDVLDLTNYEDENCVSTIFIECPNPENPEEIITPCCNTPELVEEELIVESVVNEQIKTTEAEFPESYSKLSPPSFCNLYQTSFTSSSVEYVRDSVFECAYGLSGTFPTNTFLEFNVRDYNFSNEACSSAEDIQNTNTPAQAYFHNYFGADTVAGLQGTKIPVGSFDANFTNKIQKGALWFKGDTSDRDAFILEVSKMRSPSEIDADDIITGSINPNREVRLSIFNSCSETTAIFSQNIELLTTGLQLRIEITPTEILINNGVSVTTVAETNAFPNNNFFVAIDCPIYEVEGASDPDDCENSAPTTRYRTAPPDGCYSIVTKDVILDSVKVTWDSITFTKKSTYQSVCTFDQPIVKKCKAFPYKYGKFAYWESIETYPDNPELFDSSVLRIRPEDISDLYIEDFENFYVQKSGDPLEAVLDEEGYYVLKEDTNLSCSPIRHPKFPDNKVAPFMYENAQASFTDTVIFPLGVTIDNEDVNAFLDIAVLNNLITQEIRDKITGYEILRGDIQQNRSIIASGLLFDMKKYKEQNQSENLINTDIFYSNYPYNDLGDDKLFFTDKNRNTLIPHPFEGEENDKFTFHSPETDYYRPSLPTEINVQGYMFGRSKGNFNTVEDHSKWVILSDKAKQTASYLAGLEVATEIAINAANYAETYRFGFTAGTSSGTNVNPVGAALAGAASALQAVNSLIFNFGRYRYQWLETFRNLGQPQNFSSYYYSTAKYNYLRQLQDEGNQVRSLQSIKYLKEGFNTPTNDVTGQLTQINHTDRERAVYLDLGEDFTLEYPTEYVTRDNNTIDSNTSSLTFASENNACVSGKSQEIFKNVASPYIALKNYVPAQYGTLNSVKWQTTGYYADLLNPEEGCLPIFGGDTYITRHTLKRKMPIFTESAFGLASLTPFNYKFYSNIGSNPRFYIDYEVLTDFRRGQALLPEINYDLKTDCLRKSGNYITPPTKFYLWYYGVPDFLCETRINTNNRTAKTEPKEDFYPNFSDLGRWTQEKNVSVREPNRFFYNQIFSKTTTPLSVRTLRNNFNQEESDCRADLPNGIMWSLPDNSENNFSDNWLNFRPFNYFEFPTQYGKLRDIKTIENEQILVRMENTTAIFDSVDMTIDDGQTPQARNLQSSFARRPLIFSETDLGYGGTQSSQSVSCEFGHFHTDTKRGQVIFVQNGGKGMEEISSFIGGKPSGMSNWFKNHLPFKILKYFPDVDVDNAYNGVGITMGWDSRFKRVLITKKDYIPLDQSIVYENGIFTLADTEVSLEDPQFFQNVSFTIGYSPVEQRWIGWYSYTPNYYIAHQNYFQAGWNSDDYRYGLWSHLLTNRSYQVFCGEKFPFLVEYRESRRDKGQYLKTLGWQSTTRRFHNEYDYAEIEYPTFNKLTINTNVSSSGDLHLIKNTGQISLISKYPKTAQDGTYQEVLVSKSDEFFTVNQFYNRVIKRDLNDPIWFWDKNQIQKTTNSDIVKFGGKNVLERLKSPYFDVALTQDQETRLQYTIDIVQTVKHGDN